MASKVVVGCTSGREDPDRVTVAYLTAGAALDAGKQVVMWLSAEAVRLGQKGYVQGIQSPGAPPVDRLHHQFIEKGGEFYVCPICWNARGIDEGQLVERASLKGATPLIAFAGDDAVTFTY